MKFARQFKNTSRFLPKTITVFSTAKRPGKLPENFFVCYLRGFLLENSTTHTHLRGQRGSLVAETDHLTVINLEELASGHYPMQLYMKGSRRKCTENRKQLQCHEHKKQLLARNFQKSPENL